MQNYRPFTGITPAVKILLILNIVMYFLSMFIDSRMHVDTAHLLGLHLPQSVFCHQTPLLPHRPPALRSSPLRASARSVL